MLIRGAVCFNFGFALLMWHLCNHNPFSALNSNLSFLSLHLKTRNNIKFAEVSQELAFLQFSFTVRKLSLKLGRIEKIAPT